MNKRKFFLAGSILALGGLIAGLFTSTVKAGGPALDPNGQREIENHEIPIPSRSENRRNDEKPKPPSPFNEKGIKILFSLQGENIGDGYGWLGARLGDLNGDGVNEFLVTAPFYNGGFGKIYIYSGRNGDLINSVTAPAVQYLGYSARDVGDVNHDGVSDFIVGGPVGNLAVVYSGADRSVLHQFTESPGNGFGAAVSGAGDLNGDGTIDLLVGATRYSPDASLPQAGRVDAYSGADGSLLWSFHGLYANGRLGGGVGALGDVNGDGVPEVVAAAANGGPDGRGEAYVLSGVDGTPIYTFNPEGVPGNPQTYGTFFCLGAGDLNRDGYPDIFVGDYNADNGSGALYIYSGKDGSTLYHFAGEPGEGLGPGRGVSDLDRDHHPDLIVAGYTAGPNAEGKIYFYSGGDGSLLRTITGSVPGDNLGVDALGLGDLNHDGREDFMLTAVGLDFAGLDVGHVYVVSLKPFHPHRGGHD